MDIKELRFGNIVLLNNPESWNELQNVPMKVKGIGLNPTPLDGLNEIITVEKLNPYKYDIYQDYSQLSQFIEPIPLTDEWLLNLGFRHVRNYWYNLHAKANTFNVYLYEDSTYRVEIVSQSLGIFKHVHTLQNLYFALSEKELVVSDAVF